MCKLKYLFSSFQFVSTVSGHGEGRSVCSNVENEADFGGASIPYMHMKITSHFNSVGDCCFDYDPLATLNSTRDRKISLLEFSTSILLLIQGHYCTFFCFFNLFSFLSFWSSPEIGRC